MLRIQRFFAKLLLLGLFLAPAFAGAAQEQKRNDSTLSEDIDIAVDEMNEEMAESIQLEAESTLEEYELSMVEPEKPHSMHGEHEKNHMKKRVDHEHRIGMFQLWRMMNEVELTDEQVDKFFPLWREVQKQERELGAQRRTLVKDLSKELEKDQPDESVLARLTTQISDNSKAIWEARRSGMERAMKLLTVPQKARFILAMSAADKDLRESIFRVRSGMSALPAVFDSEEFKEKMQRFNERIQEKSLRLNELGLDVRLKEAQKRYEEATKKLEEANKKLLEEKKKEDEGKK